MLNRTPQSPSRVLTLLNKKVLSNIAGSTEFRVDHHDNVQSKPLAISAQPTNSDQVEATFEALDSSIYQVKAMSNVMHKEQKEESFTLSDILPVSLGNQQTQEKENDSEKNEKMDIFDINLPMAEKIRLLRQKPEMLHNFVLEAERARKEQLSEQEKERLEQRRRHRKMFKCECLPMIEDFERHNIEALRLPQQDSIKGALLEAKIGDVESKRRRLLEMEEFSSELKLTQPRVSNILPQIFINEKNKLGAYLFLASRLGLLRHMSNVFQLRMASNMRISSAKDVILHYLRARNEFNKEQAEELAVIVIARALRKRRCARNKNLRLKILGQVKSHLLAVYQEETCLGSISQFNDTSGQLKQELLQMHQKNAARVTVLKTLVVPLEKQTAYATWHREKEQFISRQMRILQDPKEMKNLKAFLIKYPPGAVLVPDDSDNVRIAKLQLTDEQIDEMCWMLVLRTIECNADTLRENFMLNNQPGALYLNVFNAIPSHTILEQAIDTVRRGHNLREWLEENEIEPEQPQEYRG